MNKKLFGILAVGTALFGTILHGTPAHSDETPDPTAGTRAIYGNIPNDQIEFISSPDRIKSAVAGGSMTTIWETLEHGERVECLDCISAVEPLLYDANPRTREISAWWLRRRMFGVFGPGESYERTINALKSDPNPQRRAYAANALGEFLAEPGIEACKNAIETDQDPGVRAAAATALGRLNSDGAGALSRAMADGDARVRLAGLASAGRVNTFADATAVSKLTGDSNANVRRNAVELLGSLKVKDSAAALTALAKNDPDAEVRGSACHSLGELRASSARAVLEDVAKSDANGLVRDQAQIALRRL